MASSDGDGRNIDSQVKNGGGGVNLLQSSIVTLSHRTQKSRGSVQVQPVLSPS